MQFNFDSLVLFVGIIIYSFFYVLASFGYKLFTKKSYSFHTIFLVSLFFALISYCIKIPLFYYYGKENVITIYILYIFILSIAVVLYSKYVLHQKVHTHTYVILATIICLIVLNEYLSRKTLFTGYPSTAF
jgi:hypothetical protein